MEAANILIYIILIIVLVSLIGVSVWLLYDYNNLKTQLKGDFNNISNRFSTHKTKDNTLESGLNTNTSNITSTKTELTESIEAVKKEFNESVDEINVKTAKHDNNFSTFNDNLNKYFTFGTEESGINAADNKIYSYITDDNALIENDKILTLINNTIIASELTVNGGTKLKTDSDKKLKVCDTAGENCSDIYRISNDLIIKTPDATNGRIIIGDGTTANSLVIESGGNLTFKGNLVHHAGSTHTQAPPAGGGAPPAGGGAPPAGGGAPPAGGGAPPAGGGAPPAGGEAPPAGGGAPPAGGEAPPAGGGAPPADTPTSFADAAANLALAAGESLGVQNP